MSEEEGRKDAGTEGSVNPLEANLAEETQPSEAKSIEAKSIEAKSIEAKSIEAKSIEAKSIEAKSIEAKSIEAKPVEDQAVAEAQVGEEGINLDKKQENLSQEHYWGPGAKNVGNTVGAGTRLDADPNSDAPLSWWELLYGVFFQPGETLKSIVQQGLLRKALLVILVVYLLQSYASMTLSTEWLNAFSDLGDMPPEMASAFQSFTSPGMVILLALFSTGFYLLYWFGSAAIFNLTAELLGGKGNGRGLMAGIGFAQLPFILSIPVYFLVYALEWSVAWTSLVGFLLFIWVMVLTVISIRESSGLSTGMSVVTALLPGFVLLILTVLVFLVFFVSLAFLFSEIPGLL